jgi:hypothetical protein
MLEIKVVEQTNGYTVNVQGSIKCNGVYVFKATEIIQLLEFVGGIVDGKRVQVIES